VILLIPALVVVLMSIRHHYDDVARQLSLEGAEPDELPPPDHQVLILVGDVHRGVLPALRYAHAISAGAQGVYIETDPEARHRVEDRWAKWVGLPLIVLRSPYRSVVGPLLKYVDRLQQEAANRLITIILPEFLPARWWQQLLHNQTALLIKGALLFRKGVVVVDVPYHLATRGGSPVRDDPESSEPL
jgi:hypothetical protein